MAGFRLIKLLILNVLGALVLAGLGQPAYSGNSIDEFVPGTAANRAGKATEPRIEHDDRGDKTHSDAAERMREALTENKTLFEKKYGKIRNPYDPRFDPDDFEFEYYSVSSCTRREIVAKLFPIGTKKSFVERVLVDAGGARKEKSGSPSQGSRFSYSYDVKPGIHAIMDTVWNIAIEYDQSDTVLMVSMGGKSVFDYPEECNRLSDDSKRWGVIH